MKRFRSLAVLLAIGVAACKSTTEPDPLTVELNKVQFATSEEFQAWPSKPVIKAGQTLEIRGTGFVGCGTLTADASLSKDTISVRIQTKGDYSPCPLSRWPWEPFIAVVHAVPPGVYTVKVKTAGYDNEVTATVEIH